MVCCMCLLENPDIMDIFDDIGRQLKVAEIIQKYFWFKPQHNNESTSQICTMCWDKTEDFHLFYQTVEKAHKEFQHIVEQNREEIKEEETEDLMQIEVEIVDNLETEKELIIENPLESQVDDTHNDGDFEEELENESDISEYELSDTKMENTLESQVDDTHNDGDFEEDLENDCDISEYEISDTNEEAESNNGDECEIANNKVVKENQIKAPFPDKNTYSSKKNISNTVRDFEEDSEIDIEEELENASDISEYEPSDMSEAESSNEDSKIENTKDKKEVKKRTKRKAPVSDNNTNSAKKKTMFNRFDPKVLIQKHITMDCNICDFIGETFVDVTEHFRDSHPSEEPCIVCCDQKLTNRFHVKQHALKHEDPSLFRCTECNKSFATTSNLDAHNKKHHATEDALLYACDLCPKKFARRGLLDLHEPSHIPKEQWSFKCLQCPGKSFASQYLLNNHTRVYHTKAKHICNVCAKEIRDPKAFDKHMRSHYGERGPLLKCPLTNCDSWLKDEDCLKIHMRRHNPNGKIFKCPVCDKICKDRHALSHHKTNVHPNKLLKCKHCDRSFKKAIALKEHMTIHTGEILYNCPFCAKGFHSNATMYGHKKKQHPIEWAEEKRQKFIGRAAGSDKEKKEFEKQIRSHYGDSGPRLRCPFNNCNSLLKDKDCLKTHIEGHNNDNDDNNDNDETVKCPDCDKTYRNINNLRVHRHYVHSNETFPCEYCDKIFKRAITLKEHMSQHTGEALYECPFCRRKFNSNSNMYTHKKKLHPKEWAEAKKKKAQIVS